MSTSSILVVDDESEIRSLIQEILSEEGYAVQTAADATAASASYKSEHPDLVLLDIWMPDTDGITLLKQWSSEGDLSCPVVIMSGHGTVETAIEATRLGAVDYIEKPLSLANLLRTVEKALDQRREVPLRPGHPLISIAGPIGKSPLMQAMREQARQMAQHSAPLLISGEPGSGRKIFARYIHALSPRTDAPFVSIAGGSLTDQFAADRLLGAMTEDGFEPGLLEQANHGTLFINELGEMGQLAQTLLLGAIEQGGIVRPGSSQHVAIDVRIIASLRPGAALEHQDGELRTDLLATLGVLQLGVPPLREYREDIPQLLRHYVESFVDSDGLTFRRFGVAVQNRLRNYPWTGNIRELKNLVQRLLIAGGPEEIELDELESKLAPATHIEGPLVKQDLLALPLREAREQFERAYLTEQLQLCGGKVGQLAKRVGIERTHLYRKLRSLGINPKQAGSGD